jgi:hypothetical protein
VTDPPDAAPDTDETAEAKEAPKVAPPRLRRWIAGWRGVGLATAAVLAALTQVLDLRDRLFGDDMPTIGRHGAITKIKIDQSTTTRYKYCRQELDGDALETCLEGDDGFGTVFGVGIELKGYKGECCHIDWKLVEDENGEAPSPFYDKTYSGVPDVAVRNELRDIGTYRIFVPNPRRSGTFVVTFSLADRENLIETQKAPIIRIPG